MSDAVFTERHLFDFGWGIECYCSLEHGRDSVVVARLSFGLPGNPRIPEDTTAAIMQAVNGVVSDDAALVVVWEDARPYAQEGEG